MSAVWESITVLPDIKFTMFMASPNITYVNSSTKKLTNEGW